MQSPTCLRLKSLRFREGVPSFGTIFLICIIGTRFLCGNESSKGKICCGAFGLRETFPLVAYRSSQFTSPLRHHPVPLFLLVLHVTVYATESYQSQSSTNIMQTSDPTSFIGKLPSSVFVSDPVYLVHTSNILRLIKDECAYIIQRVTNKRTINDSLSINWYYTRQ